LGSVDLYRTMPAVKQQVKWDLGFCGLSKAVKAHPTVLAYYNKERY
jgi:hypothetical protein